jgi:hypothetical protein
MTPTDRATGSILSAMADAGTFRLGGTLVGTSAFRRYEGEFGLRLPFRGMANTDDFDIAQFRKLSGALEEQVASGFAETFSALKFVPLPGADPGRTWRWSKGGSGQLVELLSPAFGEETIHSLPALGVSAQALYELKFLIAAPIHAAALYRSGILVEVPRPERVATHKLIIADRRRVCAGSLKAAKDREQGAWRRRCPQARTGVSIWGTICKECYRPGASSKALQPEPRPRRSSDSNCPEISVDQTEARGILSRIDRGLQQYASVATP